MNVPTYFNWMSRAEQRKVIERLVTSGLSLASIGTLTGYTVAEIRQIRSERIEAPA